jgi:hypothetical protein
MGKRRAQTKAPLHRTTNAEPSGLGDEAAAAKRGRPGAVNLIWDPEVSRDEPVAAAVARPEPPLLELFRLTRVAQLRRQVRLEPHHSTLVHAY